MRTIILFSLILWLIMPVSGRGEVKANSIGMRFVRIAPGSFLMGSPETEKGRLSNEGPQVRVAISRPLEVAIYETTLRQFKEFLEATGYQPGTDADEEFMERWSAKPWWTVPTGEDTPVTYVSWRSAIEFCNWLSRRERLPEVYRKTPNGSYEAVDPFSGGYRLPTEAEWEYFARAGTTTAFWFGDTPDYAGEYELIGQVEGWHFAPRPAGQGRANPWGIYDVHGNVSEFVWDRKSSSYTYDGSVTDPVGAGEEGGRMLRGGSSWVQFWYRRAASRLPISETHTRYDVGFRVVRNPISATQP